LQKVAQRALAGGCLALVALVVAGPSAAGHATASAVTAKTGKTATTPCTDPQTLNVVIGAGTVTFGAMYIALVEGLFQKNCVNVNVVNNNGVALQGALLVGGQVDLAVTASAGAMAIRVQNQPLKMVMAITNYDYRSLALVGSSKFKTLQDLVSAGTNCKLGAAGTGTANYAYLKVIQAAFNIQCQVTSFPTTPSIDNALVAGQVDAVVTGPVDAVTLGKQDFPVILNPFNMPKDEQQKISPSTYPFSTIVGLDSDLQSKRTAVEGFIEALRESLALSQGLKIGTLGAITSRDTAAFPTTTLASLTQTWALVKHQLPTGLQAGFITSSAYTTLLNGLIVGQQSGVSTSDPNQAYASVVDMSYFNATKPVPACRPAVKATKGHKGRPEQQPSLKYICRLS
jgi:ABC-type nitrate/sulfonate/bicarbonate transport system substrate-binding protein